jgi:fructose-1,6-bisphosphatase/inositol monophosphatase family enzyme
VIPVSLTTLERACIDAHRAGNASCAAAEANGGDSEWLRFGLSVLLEAGRMVRAVRLLPMDDVVRFKSDGSPVTRHEHEIEALVLDRLTQFSRETAFVGEEHGGSLPARGIAVALDPVDGTWSLVNRTETCATGLAFFRDGAPFLGMVLNPVTGELGYAAPETGSRLLQLSLFGEEDVACPLPTDRGPPSSPLVNLHPHRHAGALLGDLSEEWRKGGLNMVKLPGGSPLWAMLEAAKGNFVYVNLWSTQPAAPYELAAGILLIRGAGGDVTDLAGKPIGVTGHRGAFIAGVDEEARKKVAAIARRSLE